MEMKHFRIRYIKYIICRSIIIPKVLWVTLCCNAFGALSVMLFCGRNGSNGNRKRRHDPNAGGLTLHLYGIKYVPFFCDKILVWDLEKTWKDEILWSLQTAELFWFRWIFLDLALRHGTRRQERRQKVMSGCKCRDQPVWEQLSRSCWNQLPLPVGADRALGWHCHHASCRWDNMGQQKTVPAPWCSQFIPNVDVTLQGVFTALPVFFGWFCYQWYYATWKPLESFESFSRGRYSCTVIWGTLLVLVPPWCCDDSLWSVLRMLLLQSRLQVSSGSMGLANHAS